MLLLYPDFFLPLIIILSKWVSRAIFKSLVRLVQGLNSGLLGHWWTHFPQSQNYSSQVRRTRHAGHCWRSRDELIRDVLLWIPTHGRAKAGRPARTYIQQLCEDTGCCPEDLPRAMNDREEWRKRVRDIRAASTIWWWYITQKKS